MKIASRSIDLKLAKKQIACAAHFFSNQQKHKFGPAAPFLAYLPLFCTTTTLFCRTKTSNFLVTHYFYGEIVIMCLPNTLSPVRVHACMLLFFTVGHFHLAGCQHFSLSHSHCEFSCFSSYKIVFNHLLQLFLYYPCECKHQK